MAITKVTNSLVATNAIQGTLIADNAITSVHIAQNQVTSVQIPDGSITSTQLAANSVDTAELISGSIDAIHLASDSVTTAKILDANITTAKIANNAITSALIPDGSITDTQLGSGAFTMGNITTTGSIRGPASLTIDPATVGDNTGTVVIAGNLQVDGTTTTVNSTTLDVVDKNITLGKGGSASANNGGGITIDGADATILYTHSGTKWSFNKDIEVSKVNTNTVNNVGNTANIIYRTSTHTIVGNNASALVVQDGGNIGMGTTSPKVLSGQRSLTINATVPRIDFKVGDAFKHAVIAEAEYISISADPDNNQANSRILFAVDSATRMTLDSSGDVTIADGDLYLGGGTGQTFMQIASGTSGAKTWRIYNGISWNPDALLIYNHTNDSTALTIEPEKLGVNRGASSLTQSFEVGGTGLFTGIVAINKGINASVGLSVGSDANSATSYGLEVCDSSSQTRFLIDGAGSQRFYGSDNSETARFTNGKLGINRDPGVELDIKRKTNATPLRVGSEGGQGRAMVFADVASTPTKYNWIAGSQYTLDNAFEITPSTAVGGYTFSNPAIVVKNNGHVGIGGISALNSKFNVFGDGEVLRVDGTGNTSRTIRFRNVGVNGSSNGIIMSDGTLQLKNEDANAAIYLNSVRDIEFQTTSGNGTAGHMRFYSYNTQIMHIDGANNRVGIRTDDPSAHLTVFDTTSPQLSLDYGGGSNNGGSINFNLINAGVPDALTTQIKVIDDGAYRQHLTFLTKTSGAASSGMSERMRITSSGEVGIGLGSSNPQGRLEIRVQEGEGGVMIGSSSSTANQNKTQMLQCASTLGGSNVWKDVAYIGHSGTFRILGKSIQSGSSAYGGASTDATVSVQYGSASVTHHHQQYIGMNGGDVTGNMEYRYLNSGATNGNYRLQVRVPYSGGTHIVYTSITGISHDEIYEDDA
jgi:hypothetical protein